MLKRRWSDRREKVTAKLLLDLLSVSDEELSSILKSVDGLVETKSEMAIFYLKAIMGLIRKWLEWENRCREKSCPEELPEEAKIYGVASYYSTSLKETIIISMEDTAIPWGIPSWALWFSRRIRRPLTSLYNLDIEEQLARLIVYPLFVYSLRSFSSLMLQFYEKRGSGYAAVTAGFIHWDIIVPMYEAVAKAVNPVRRLLGESLDAAATVIVNAKTEFEEEFREIIMLAKNNLLRAIIREKFSEVS